MDLNFLKALAGGGMDDSGDGLDYGGLAWQTALQGMMTPQRGIHPLNRILSSIAQIPMTQRILEQQGQQNQLANWIKQISIAKSMQDMEKTPLEIQELQGKIQRQPLDLEKLRGEIEQQPYSTEKTRQEMLDKKMGNMKTAQGLEMDRQWYDEEVPVIRQLALGLTDDKALANGLNMDLLAKIKGIQSASSGTTRNFDDGSSVTIPGVNLAMLTGLSREDADKLLSKNVEDRRQSLDKMGQYKDLQDFTLKRDAENNKVKKEIADDRIKDPTKMASLDTRARESAIASVVAKMGGNTREFTGKRPEEWKDQRAYEMFLQEWEKFRKLYRVKLARPSDEFDMMDYLKSGNLSKDGYDFDIGNTMEASKNLAFGGR